VPGFARTVRSDAAAEVQARVKRFREEQANSRMDFFGIAQKLVPSTILPSSPNDFNFAPKIRTDQAGFTKGLKLMCLASVFKGAAFFSYR
jgi:hypothetical protein